MIKVIMKFTIKKEYIDEFAEHIPGYVPATRGEEGCLDVQLMRDENQKGVFIVVEEWEDEASLAIHHETPSWNHLQRKQLDVRERELEIYICNVIV